MSKVTVIRNLPASGCCQVPSIIILNTFTCHVAKKLLPMCSQKTEEQWI